MKYADRVYWHTHSYGSAIAINRSRVIQIYTVLAVIVPIIIPLPLVGVLYKVLPKRMMWRRG